MSTRRFLPSPDQNQNHHQDNRNHQQDGTGEQTHVPIAAFFSWPGRNGRNCRRLERASCDIGRHGLHDWPTGKPPVPAAKLRPAGPAMAGRCKPRRLRGPDCNSWRCQQGTELRKNGGGRAPILPAGSPHERTGADASLGDPGPHDLARRRTELPARSPGARTRRRVGASSIGSVRLRAKLLRGGTGRRGWRRPTERVAAAAVGLRIDGLGSTRMPNRTPTAHRRPVDRRRERRRALRISGRSLSCRSERL